MAHFDRTAQIDDYIISTILSLRVFEATFDDLVDDDPGQAAAIMADMRPRHAPQGIIEGLVCFEAIG